MLGYRSTRYEYFNRGKPLKHARPWTHLSHETGERLCPKNKKIKLIKKN
jgi:hypothetical protein